MIKGLTSILLTFTLTLSGCSSVTSVTTPIERAPSNEDLSCNELARYFFFKPEELQSPLERVLIERKLITRTNKFVTIQHPRLDWLNRVRSSLNKTIRNWNNNQHPAFYIFNDEEVTHEAKEYFETVSSIVTPDMALAPNANKNLEAVTGWIKSFESYQKDIDELLDERISLQYNLSLLKKIKIQGDTQDVRLSYKRGGKLIEEVITLRKSDKNQGYYIKKLQTEISDLDGTLLKNGKIKDRVIRQAVLMDIITILQREFEYGIKNAEYSHPELIKELNRLNALLKTSEFQPTTYGVYRVTNKIFIRELVALTKLDVAYKNFIETPLLKIKEIVDAFIQNRPANLSTAANEVEKAGILKRIYARISQITLKQASVGGAVAVVGGIGYQRYFAIKESTMTELQDNKDGAEQLERTKAEVVKKNEEHAEVIEVQIGELTK